MNSKGIQPDKLKILYENLLPKFLLKSIILKDETQYLLNTTFDEVKTLIKKITDGSKFKSLFLNIKYLPDKLLYGDKEIIDVKRDDCQQNWSEYFYLVKLIKEKKYIIIFSYNFEFIQNINNENRKCDKTLRKVIISKIILDLINNYKGLDNDKKNYEKEIEEIEEENKSLIKNNINYLNKEIGLNIDIEKALKLEVEDLYIEIIFTLIINKKLEDDTFV